MTETTVVLCLSQEQGGLLLTHLLVYLMSFIVHPPTPGQRAIREQIQEVAYRLVHLDGGAREGSVLVLSVPEAGAIKEVFTILQPLYEQSLPTDEISILALAHLTTCRVLIEEAEQQANVRRESR